MLQAVKVRLRKPTRVFVFLARDLSLSRGDTCVARTDRGLEYGTCIVEPEDCSEEMAKRYAMSVVRKATEHDRKTFATLLQDEMRARGLCSRKISERRLPMTLVDVEYTFDRHKVIFYFTAEERVDFRELVRDLAHDLKARIELRHIQVRDKAKLVGGFAACGRELCCATWLPDFMPISMKMAKRQNLSLNPTKISGQCGRLMCCLSYENDQYDSRKRPKPPPGVEEEKVPPAEWKALLEEEGAEVEEEEIEAQESHDEVAVGETVLVVNPDGTEEVPEDAEEEDRAGTPETPDAAGGSQETQARRRPRRRRRKRRSPEGGGNAPGGQ